MTSTTLPPQMPAAGGAPEVLAQASELVGGLYDVLWAARSSGEKMDTFAVAEALKSQIEAVQLDIVRDLDASKGVEELGWASTADFVTAVSGGHKGSGSATVRLAKAVDAPPLAATGDSLAAGWLSITKAHVLERTVDRLPLKPELREKAVGLLLEEAKRLDASDLRKAGRRLIATVDPEGEERREEKAMDREERAAHLNRSLSIRDDGAGGAFIKGRCTIEDAATIRATLLPLAKPQPNAGPCDPNTCEFPGCGHDGRDPRDHGARMLDAMVEACRRVQRTGMLPESHGAVPRISVTISYDDLKDATGYGTTDTGEDLSPGTVRKMACDADILPVVLGEDSAVVDVGRMMRLVTAAIWYALVVRDRHCRFPGCTRPPVMCHAHHVIHWIDGGPTSLDNLVLLCGHHHRLVHSGPWTITQPRPALFQFSPPDAVRRARGPRPDRAPPAE